MYKSCRKVFLITRGFSMSVHNEKKGGKTSPSIKSAENADKNGKRYSSYSDNETSSTGSNESTHSIVKNEVQSESTGTPPEVKAKRLSKRLRKKFYQHFPNIEDDEEVLDRYACALLNDLLLQGYLYITTNYFGFYSNVFGYVTKLLIPILTVGDITKEKTAKIFNNAIGIVTPEQKHVFGSFMSRDSALEQMRSVWEKAKSEAALLENELSEQGLDYSELDEDEVDLAEQPRSEISHLKGSRKISMVVMKMPKTITYIKKIKRQRILTIATIALLIILYTSAALLLYRICEMREKFSTVLEDAKNTESHSIYRDILEIQTELRSKSEGAVFNFLDSNLDQIAKVKKSLETLSSLLIDTSYFKERHGSGPQERPKT